MKKRISIRGTIENQTTRFHKVKMEKVERSCPECGGTVCPEKPYGTIFVPRSAGSPEEILISIKRKEGEGPDDRKNDL